MTQVVTTGAADWLGDRRPPEMLRVFMRRGRFWLRKAGLPTGSDDLAILAYLCLRRMSDYAHGGRLDEDYLAAGEVLDNYVTDHDAELLCELVPLTPEYPVGGMSPEVTAVHTALLLVVGAMREAWEDDE